MATEGADQRYLLAREMGMCRRRPSAHKNRLDDLPPGDSEAAIEQGWYDYCFRKHEEVAWELDKIENPHKYSVANVPHEALTISTAKQNKTGSARHPSRMTGRFLFRRRAVSCCFASGR
jgi:hypothetical protein